MRKVLFWILVALNIGDYWLTTLILENGGYEANPLVNWFIQTYGNIGILVLKVPFMLIFGYSIYFLWDRLSPSFAQFTERALYFLVAIYALLDLYSLGIYTFMLHK